MWAGVPALGQPPGTTHSATLPEVAGAQRKGRVTGLHTWAPYGQTEG